MRAGDLKNSTLSIEYIHFYIDLHTLLGTPCEYRVGPCFALVLRGTDFTRCWKHSSRILVRTVVTASRSCCKFVSLTCIMWIPFHHISKVLVERVVGRLSAASSLPYLRNQTDKVWVLWYGDCWKQLSEEGYTVAIKGLTWSASILG